MLGFGTLVKRLTSTWIPDPMTAAKSRLLKGGRKTSPCTSFHPWISLSLFRKADSLITCLLNALFNVIVSHVVLCNVTPQGADDDHRYDPGEEEDHHNRVDNGEPVDLSVLHVQVDIPPRGPLHFTLLPLNRVGEVKIGFSILVHFLWPLAVHLATVSLNLDPSFVHTLGLYQKANNPVGAQILIQVIFHDEFEVVVEVEFAPILVTQSVAWLILDLYRIVRHRKSREAK